MPFAPVPPESKKQINKAAKLLVGESAWKNVDEFLSALDLVSRWRACHAYPINTFQATLRTKVKNYSQDPIVAQRLKRMPTIIDKLKRFPNMQLTTMQDIGGLRAIMATVKDVSKIANDYRSNKRLPHELIDEKDYISTPRDEDGYRSTHLVYRYQNSSHPSYDGLRVELQIRTRLQHTWATAVETMGTLLGQALKSRQGDKNWIDFFAAVSSAFAHREGTPLVPRFAQFSESQTYEKVAEIEKSIGALEIMRGVSTAVNEITETNRGWSYHLIILNSLEKTVDVIGYDRESFALAERDFSEAEKRAAEGEKIEPVLVSAGPIDKIKRAYPNFFLDIRDFTSTVNQMVKKAGA